MEGGSGGGRGGGWRGRRGFPGRFRGRWQSYKRGNRGGGRGQGAPRGNDDEDRSRNGNNQPLGGFRGGFVGRGGNRGRGSYNNGRSESSNDGGGGENRSVEEDNVPVPRKKKRNDPLQTIKENVTSHWRKMLPGYDLYYCDTTPQLPEFEKKVKAVEAFLTRIGFAEDTVEAEREESADSYYKMSFDEIVKDQVLLSSWPDFQTDLIEDPEETIALWSVTAHKVVHNMMQAQGPPSDSDDSDPGKTPMIQIGFSKMDQVTPLLAMKSGLLGTFVTIKGAIVRTGNIHPYCRRLTFCCKICDTDFALEQPEGKYSPPAVCKAEECTNNNPYLFEVKERARTTVVVDSRRIRIQDILHCDIERGSVPRTMDCILFGELADQCCTGDAVTLSGVVKMSKESNHAGEQSLHNMFIEVSSITQHKDSESSMGGHLFNFTNKDYCAVQEIHDTPDLFRLLIASLCPSIYGHELVKAGLLLCLFGGTPCEEGLVLRRSDINMLMVGDPGIGKSQMLKVLTEVAPKAVYVCGTGSTVAGLTVTLVRDGDDYSLEAGALVMSDKGICCIDEFDKMGAQHHALLEALEQQSVSVAKSGVYRTLPARTTVIAAANPVGGHYDVCKTVVENIKINPALMSRFDLIFILLDRPDQEFDQKLIDHMMGIRNISRQLVGTPNRPTGECPGNGEPRRELEPLPDQTLLINRVRIRAGEVFDLIPHPLLRKYIAYAKQYVHPKLSAEAAEVLKKYYLNLRLSHRSMDSTPVTARQLESLVRLTEARAKLELREEATVDDANDVLEIFDFSLSSVFDDEVHAVSALSTSVLLNSTISSGRSKSVASLAKKLVKALQDLSEKLSKNIFSVDEIRSLAAAIGCKDKCDSLIATLNNEGFLLKKGGKTYQLQTTDY